VFTYHYIADALHIQTMLSNSGLFFFAYGIPLMLGSAREYDAGLKSFGMLDGSALIAAVLAYLQLFSCCPRMTPQADLRDRPHVFEQCGELVLIGA